MNAFAVHESGGRSRLAPSFSPRTVPSLLAERARSNPDALALAGFAEEGDFRRLTLAELLDAARAAGARLIERGVEPGDAVAWVADNSSALDALVAYHAIAAVGGVNLPLNPRLSRAEVSSILRRSKPRLVLHAAPATDLARAAADDADGPAGVGVIPLAEIVFAGTSGNDLRESVEARTSAVDPQSAAVILFTSGTTGTSKGVVHSHESSLAAGIGWGDAMELERGDVLQSPYPVFSGAGLHFNGLACLWWGAAYAIDLPAIGPMLERVGLLGTTVFVAVPSIYQFWLAAPEFDPGRLGTLRLLDYGGAAMPASVIERLRQALPDVALLQTYGLTEAGPGGTYLPPERAISRLGSIGNRGAGGLRFRIVDGDGGDVGTGEAGELLVRGPSVMVGYHDDPDATASVLSPDGWLRTGDLVRADADGFLFFVDRSKDIIVRGGYNIGSVEVEEALCAHPEVLEAAVVGVPHERLGEAVAAFVVPVPGSSPEAEALIEHCGTLLADFKRPSTVELRSELPRNAAGKVLKASLRNSGGVG